MKIINQLILLTALSLVFTACNEYKGYKKTESGLYYKFYSQNLSGYIPKNDDVVSIKLEIRTKNDSIIQPMKQLTTMMQPSKFQGDIFEALSMMHEGDSASFIINAKKYFNAYNYGIVPPFVDEKTMLWFTIKITKIETVVEYKLKSQQLMIDKEKELINQYVTENNITVTPTVSGLYYIETKKGKGASPSEGQTCYVHYKGMLLDGTVFDSSIERGEPFPFPLGQGQVIKGWDEGIAMMKKGGKALFIIPSSIAYGDRGAGDLIPPYTPLLFEVELVNFQ
ncbi:MAG TPA: FKBP-type peptidyl-prolyl cis-trans isomerase [Bacteroidales bacterium]|nr:FKBP-type peptidyl-prolyl cis-trans isomerase [Bacteroidales bacterium]HON20592.1 FKBP-type peptidyl-prolyl cis-trans isomerase [Bacteroidales bacterium]HOR81574.1 FKBP-type peptidyl-prolyl cis-trans isomerase [Bacteroidales bacterium]HPJ90348.1 FKBP-type peptidyl-prolyl cis-trans isomerase [Bacteroidales bacterium]